MLNLIGGLLGGGKGGALKTIQKLSMNFIRVRRREIR